MRWLSHPLPLSSLSVIPSSVIPGQNSPTRNATPPHLRDLIDLATPPHLRAMRRDLIGTGGTGPLRPITTQPRDNFGTWCYLKKR